MVVGRGQITIACINDGNSGTSPYFAYLDNGMDSVVCDANGYTTTEQYIEANVYLFNGNTKCTILGVNCYIGSYQLYNNYASIGSRTPATNFKKDVSNLNTTSAKVKIYIKENTNITSCNFNVNVLTTIDGEGVSADTVFTMNGIRPGPDGKNAVIYNLLPSVSDINVSRTDAGGYNPSTYNLTCGYRKNDGGSITSVANATSRIDSKYYVFYRRRTRSNKTWESTYYRYPDYYSQSAYSLTALDVTTYDAVEFVICSANRETITNPNSYTVVDRQTVPVVSDGMKGGKGKDAQYIYLRGTAYDADNPDGTFPVPAVVNVNGGDNLSYSGRGLNYVAINRQTLLFVENENYDTFGAAEGDPDSATRITELINTLDSLDDSVFVCLVSFDAIGWTDELISKLQSFGMGELPYTDNWRHPFLFIGYKGLGKGNGLMRMRDAGATTDFVELSVYVANGALSSHDGQNAVSVSLVPNNAIITQSNEKDGNSYPLLSVGTLNNQTIYAKTTVKVVEGNIERSNFTIGTPVVSTVTHQGTSYTTCDVVVSGDTIGISAVRVVNNKYVDSGIVTVPVTYKGQTYNVAFNFYCNLLGTWKETIDADTRTIAASSAVTELDNRGVPARGAFDYTSVTSSKEQFDTFKSNYESGGQNINNLNTRVSTAEGNISTVRKTISGSNNNLIINGAFIRDAHDWSEWGSPTTREIVTDSLGRKWMHIVSTTTQWEGYAQRHYDDYGIKVVAGEKYTVSLRAYSASGTATISVGYHLYNGFGDSFVTQDWKYFTINTTEAVYSAQFTIPNGGDNFYFMVGDSTTTVQEFYITDIKLELGEIATAWTDNSAESYTEIKQTADGITSTVNGLGNRVTTIEQTAEKISMNVNNGFRNYVTYPLAVDAPNGVGTFMVVNDSYFGKVKQIYKNGTGDFQLQCGFEEDYRDDLQGQTVTLFAIVKSLTNGYGQVYFGIWSNNYAMPELMHVTSTDGVVTSVTSVCNDASYKSGYQPLVNGWYKVWVSFNAGSIFSEDKDACGPNTVNYSTWQIYYFGIVQGFGCPDVETIRQKDGLLRTGIDITSGLINLVADKTTFSTSAGVPMIAIQMCNNNNQVGVGADYNIPSIVFYDGEIGSGGEVKYVLNYKGLIAATTQGTRPRFEQIGSRIYKFEYDNGSEYLRVGEANTYIIDARDFTFLLANSNLREETAYRFYLGYYTSGGVIYYQPNSDALEYQEHSVDNNNVVERLWLTTELDTVNSAIPRCSAIYTSNGDLVWNTNMCTTKNGYYVPNDSDSRNAPLQGYYFTYKKRYTDYYSFPYDELYSDIENGSRSYQPDPFYPPEEPQHADEERTSIDVYNLVYYNKGVAEIRGAFAVALYKKKPYSGIIWEVQKYGIRTYDLNTDTLAGSQWERELELQNIINEQS